MNEELIIIRGGGDLATGVIQKLHRSGFPLLVLEVAKPTAIRRSVALCEAIYEGRKQVEDVEAHYIRDLEERFNVWSDNAIPIYIDPLGESIIKLEPHAVIDATLAKRNLGMHQGMAPITIALGPGFSAGKDVDLVIETMRGHDLARLIKQGEALPNSGIPGEIGGKSHQRVIHLPVSGSLKAHALIGQVVEQGSLIASVGDTAIIAPFTGILRGMIREGLDLPKGMKIADIDPRLDVDCTTISDKARALGGAVLEAYLYRKNQLVRIKE